MKNIKKATIIFVILLFVVALSLPIYFNSEIYAASSLANQIDLNIKTQNTDYFRKVASDSATYYFLSHLKAGVRCHQTSGMQGIMNNDYYYVTVLDDHKIGVFVTKKGFFLLPEWKIHNLELQ